MKTKLSVAFDQLKGSAGNISAKTGYQGQITLKRTAPRQPKSQRQSRSKMIFSNISKRWTSIPDTARQSWKDVAISPITGYSLFCQNNRNLSSISRPLIDFYSPLKASYYPIKPQFTTNNVFSELILKLDTSSVAEDVSFLLRLSAPTKNFKSSFSYNPINFLHLNQKGENIIDITDLYKRYFLKLPTDVNPFYYELYSVERNSGDRCLLSSAVVAPTTEHTPVPADISIISNACAPYSGDRFNEEEDYLLDFDLFTSFSVNNNTKCDPFYVVVTLKSFGLYRGFQTTLTTRIDDIDLTSQLQVFNNIRLSGNSLASKFVVRKTSKFIITYQFKNVSDDSVFKTYTADCNIGDNSRTMDIIDGSFNVLRYYLTSRDEIEIKTSFYADDDTGDFSSSKYTRFILLLLRNNLKTLMLYCYSQEYAIAPHVSSFNEQNAELLPYPAEFSNPEIVDTIALTIGYHFDNERTFLYYIDADGVELE